MIPPLRDVALIILLVPMLLCLLIPLALLFARVAGPVAEPGAPEAAGTFWRGLRLVSGDGMGLDVADTPLGKWLVAEGGVSAERLGFFKGSPLGREAGGALLYLPTATRGMRRAENPVLIQLSEPTRLRRICYAVFCL